SAHATRFDRGDVHAQRAELGGEHFGKTANGPLGCLVSRHAGCADAATDGGNIDDVAAATLAHVADGGAGEVHHAEQIGFDLRPVIGRRHLFEGDELTVA